MGWIKMNMFFSKYNGLNSNEYVLFRVQWIEFKWICSLQSTMGWNQMNMFSSEFHGLKSNEYVLFKVPWVEIKWIWSLQISTIHPFFFLFFLLLQLVKRKLGKIRRVYFWKFYTLTLFLNSCRFRIDDNKTLYINKASSNLDYYLQVRAA